MIRSTEACSGTGTGTVEGDSGCIGRDRGAVGENDRESCAV
jgi:hypothetical protein